MWNQRYSQTSFVYGQKPNEFFQKTIEALNLEGKNMLLAAEGEGRNAIYAAKLGWKVYAFDASEVAVQKALKWAEKEGVQLNYDIQSYYDLDLPPRAFDVAGLIYAHMSDDIRSLVHQKIVDSLRPGGIIVLEAFDKSQLGASSGGPKTLDMLYELDMLKQDFEGMEFNYLQKVQIVLDEGPFHQGEATVDRMIATKPN